MKLRIALDWTPNVIHSGLLLALHHRLFAQEGLEVEYLSTEIDNYTKKPIGRLVNGEVDLAIGPTEHLFFFGALDKSAPPLVALATVMQPNMSAFVVKDNGNIPSPRHLDGKKYIGYNTPLEQNILEQMIRADGGTGTFTTITPPRLDVFEAFLQDQGHVSWVFVPWEAELARHRGVPLKEFHLDEYGVPYGYSTLFFARQETLEQKSQALSIFFRILSDSYVKAAENPAAVASQLSSAIDHSNFGDARFIENAMNRIAPALLNASGRWGQMEAGRFDRYARWLHEKNLIDEDAMYAIGHYKLFDNAFLM
jgi:ABC-type nitrate/sulfonate/bicarbonate transport system substrate-binding protein